MLDLGAGGGFDCFLAAKQVGPTGRVIGVDMTPEMVVEGPGERAEARGEERRVPARGDRASARRRRHGRRHPLQLRDQPEPRQGRGVPGSVPRAEARRPPRDLGCGDHEDPAGRTRQRGRRAHRVRRGCGERRHDPRAAPRGGLREHPRRREGGEPRVHSRLDARIRASRTTSRRRPSRP